MLYVEDDTRGLWPSVARALASLESLDMVLCIDPSDACEQYPAPFRAPEGDEYLEPVPSYEGVTRVSSQRVAVNEELLSWLESRVGDFEDWGDSLAVYRPGNYALVAAVIPSEGMILVTDEFGSALAASGFRLSDEPPDWWQRPA